ncbi:Sugar kinase of the NBD/HSP70 family, may contain an N-terminal HTH domain [Pedococcus dokdonensis]|uniref:Sugar kinase of the NBD/HSP70 family, may contain an N-terminal HTH domain n=1 Tax=Pedococcus dokdonensis TaxID=443156 RepID=A0A1H0URE3_9MICO|nr:winged helix-turn-helix domain-containing protein [Pedococcus dokdonensis]SDP68690.1 Sugar kinase of the NBD/HSP70 family, may contain an N-terminal HTH domain [Pedococcus dokdonensis]
MTWTAKPSLDLVRTVTDDTVLKLLMENARITRADIAARSGISKTTVSESMRRLEALGIVTDTGERTSGRGRSGSYYAVAPGQGSAMAVSITPAAVVAEVVDPRGTALARSQIALAAGARTGEAAAALRTACKRVAAAADGVVAVAVVSAADPVDRHSGRLVQIPDAPFLVGDLDPVSIVGSLASGSVVVDNDVNWAARAEALAGAAAGVSDFVYLHLGEGLGCAVVSDGEVRRGHTGLAGEIAHVVVPGARRSSIPFTEVFAQLGLRRPGSTAVDVGAVVAAIDDQPQLRAALADAVAAVLLAAVGFLDPQFLVVGGGWGAHPAFVAELALRSSLWPRPTRIAAAALDAEPDLAGARAHAVELLRDAIMRTAQTNRR